MYKAFRRYGSLGESLRLYWFQNFWHTIRTCIFRPYAYSYVSLGYWDVRIFCHTPYNCREYPLCEPSGVWPSRNFARNVCCKPHTYRAFHLYESSCVLSGRYWWKSPCYKPCRLPFPYLQCAFLRASLHSLLTWIFYHRHHIQMFLPCALPCGHPYWHVGKMSYHILYKKMVSLQYVFSYAYWGYWCAQKSCCIFHTHEVSAPQL